MNVSKACAAALSVALLPACVYTNVVAPLAYRSPTPSDVSAPLGPEVEGEACSKLVLWLVAWGDGGYGAAVEDAMVHGGAVLLADVRADRRVFNILGVYQKACTHVRGRSVR